MGGNQEDLRSYSGSTGKEHANLRHDANGWPSSNSGYQCPIDNNNSNDEIIYFEEHRTSIAEPIWPESWWVWLLMAQLLDPQQDSLDSISPHSDSCFYFLCHNRTKMKTGWYTLVSLSPNGRQMHLQWQTKLCTIIAFWWSIIQWVVYCVSWVNNNIFRLTKIQKITEKIYPKIVL